jgi:glycosyltransferase involved in cell wall biosynthesis
VSQIALHVDCVLVVDDGSEDDSAAVAGNSGAEVLRHNVNKGKGAALVSGFKKSLNEGFDILVTIDADGENDPNDIPILVYRLICSNADATLGCRTNTHTSLIFGFKLTQAILKDLVGINIDDAMCGLRAYRSQCIRRILPMLKSTGFGIDLEIVLLLLLSSVALVEVPVSGHNLIAHNGIKPSHLNEFFRNLRIYSAFFKEGSQIRLTNLLSAVQTFDDFEFTLGTTNKIFRFNNRTNLYE